MPFCKRCGHSDELHESPEVTTLDAKDILPTRLKLKLSLMDIEATMEDLSRKKLLLARQLNSFSPILNLPGELLVEIMLTTFPENSWNIWGSDTPLLFGSICSTWRRAAWSTPHLWRTISLSTTHYSAANTLVLHEWIDRSGTLPLSLHFTMRHPMVRLPEGGGNSRGMSIQRPPLDPQVAKMLSLLARYSQRWQDIDFDLFTYPKDFFHILPTSFPLLRSMSLSIARPPPRSFAIGASVGRQAHWNAPLLRAITVDNQIMTYLDLPLGQITHFSFIKTVELGECLDALRLTPRLNSCTFTCMSSSLRPVLRPAVTSHNLKYLDVEFQPIHTSLAFPALLDNLTCPSLQTLRLRIISPGAYYVYASLVSFLIRSACPLARLSLSGGRLSAPELAQCLATIPSLIDLTLKKMELSGDTLRDLHLRPHSSNTLLPNLQRFTYKGPSHLDFSALVMMASSRWRVNTSDRVGKSYDGTGELNYVLIDVREASGSIELESVTVLELMRLKSEGMRIEILAS